MLKKRLGETPKPARGTRALPGQPFAKRRESIARRWLYWKLDLVSLGELNRARIPGISMPKDAHPRIAGKDALQTALGTLGPICNHDHAGMLRITDSDAAAVMN